MITRILPITCRFVACGTRWSPSADHPVLHVRVAAPVTGGLPPWRGCARLLPCPAPPGVIRIWPGSDIRGRRGRARVIVQLAGRGQRRWRVPARKRRSPQEKKRLSYSRDRRNYYGENDKSSRKNIARHKRRRHRAERHSVRQHLAAAGPAGEDAGALVQDRWRARTRAEHLTWAFTLGTRALSLRLSAHGPVVRLAGAPRPQRCFQERGNLGAPA